MYSVHSARDVGDQDGVLWLADALSVNDVSNHVSDVNDREIKGCCADG